MRKIFLFCLFLCLLTVPCCAVTESVWPGSTDGAMEEEQTERAGEDTIRHEAMVEDDAPRKGGHKLRNGFLNSIYQFVKNFSAVDTNYVEPQAYNFTLMLQNTNTYETYKLGFPNGRSITFSPKPSIKLGPYFGWRWIFLGYTIDFARLSDDDHKQDFSLSLYSNQLGVDLFYRKSGDVYKITDLRLGHGIDTSPMKDVTFNGFQSSVKGFNLYYIFNHKKFSYPAAYSQSNIQRRSAGSALVGIGYTHHKLSIDWDEFRSLASSRLGEDLVEREIDSTMMAGKVNYYDISVSGGYAYNWVFAHNWLLDVSLTVGLAYNQAKNENRSILFQDFIENFDIKNINADLVSRVGLVYNNMRWYAGLSAVFHSYNYKKDQFYTNNSFGYLNIYVGFNFGKRR